MVMGGDGDGVRALARIIHPYFSTRRDSADLIIELI
jgi:hypothetical protein